MDFTFSEDQIQIANQARRFLENESPMEYVRAMWEDERGFTEALWSKMAEMGWLGMRIPEAYGGMEMDLVDLSVVLEEMGRAALPGPFFSTVMLAAECLMEAGNGGQKEAWLPGIAEGAARGTLALQEPDGGADPGYVRMEAREDGDGYVLDGIKLFVPDAHVADFLICAARTKPGEDPVHGLTLFLLEPGAEGVTMSLLPSMDGTRKLCEVRFEGVRIPSEGIMGAVQEGWSPLRRVLQRAQVGLGAECVGGAERAMEIAVDYAKIRYQFGQPIGSYQAIKHLCADMFVAVESARSVLYWAAWAQDRGGAHEAAVGAATAKAYCSEVFKQVTASTIQVLGGTGFTWEHDIHIYFKRAKANEVALGDPAYQREEVTRLLEADGHGFF